MKASSKTFRDWLPVEIAKHKDSKGNQLQIPAGSLAGIDGDKFPPLLVRLGSESEARSIASAEWIDAVPGQDKARVSAALWAALETPPVQYAKAEIRRATVGERIRHDGALRSYLTAALITFVGACFGVVAAMPHPPVWAGIVSAAMVVVGLVWAATQKIRGGD